MHRRGVLGSICVVIAVAASACGIHTNRSSGPTTTVFSPTTVAPTAAPPVTTSDSGFVAFGDFGGGDSQQAVADQMTAWAASHRVDALVTTGDNVYETGMPKLFDDYLDEPYAALRETRPMWVTLGNHDVDGGHGHEQLRYLGLPELPYAMTLPGVQLLFLNGNRPNVSQRDWLDARLSEPGPALRVVVFHQPPYSCGPHGSSRVITRRWVPVLEAHRVALVLSGHDHLYERFTSASGVTYVVTGGGGKDLYPARRTCRGVGTKEAIIVRHHFTAVEVTGTTLTLTAVARNGTVLDSATITR